MTSQQPKLTLYGAPEMRTGRPLFMLEELGLSYTHVNINPTKFYNRMFLIQGQLIYQ